VKRRATVIAVVTAMLAVGVPSTAAASLKAIWGPDVLPGGKSAYPTYERLGVDVIERQLSWRDVATRRPAHPRDPADPAYAWPASLDAAMAQAGSRGIRFALMIKGTPRWANGGRSRAHAPKHVGDYADFAAAAARRYRSVRYWMVWGEPTRRGSFEPMSPGSRRGPRIYAEMLDRTYGALKSVRRSNVVIGGMTWTLGIQPPPTFLARMRLPNGRPPRLDWFGHNPFSVRFPDLHKDPYYKGLRDISDSDTLAREVRHVYKRIHRRPKLWLSEFTVQSDHANRAFSFFVSRAAQARWITAAYRLAHRDKAIAGLGWYSLIDDPDPLSGLTGGLLDAAGDPKPAFAAYRRAP
jgi:hypothetical protein